MNFGTRLRDGVRLIGTRSAFDVNGRYATQAGYPSPRFAEIFSLPYHFAALGLCVACDWADRYGWRRFAERTDWRWRFDN